MLQNPHADESVEIPGDVVSTQSEAASAYLVELFQHAKDSRANINNWIQVLYLTEWTYQVAYCKILKRTRVDRR